MLNAQRPAKKRKPSELLEKSETIIYRAGAGRVLLAVELLIFGRGQLLPFEVSEEIAQIQHVRTTLKNQNAFG